MTRYRVTNRHPHYFTLRFLSLLARARQHLIGAAVALGLFATIAHADSFQDVITLAEQGVPELALHIIDQQQTSIDPLAAEWAAWEKARILIYQQRRDWASVVHRTQALVASGILPLATLAHTGAAPDNLSLTFARWVLTQGAAAQLESGQGAAARAWLLRLIWQAAVPGCTDAASAGCAGAADNADSQLFAQWRRMVIHSYIMDGRVDDAYTALLRYQQDYANSTNAQIYMLQAHVLLLTERAAEAMTLLAGMQEPTAAALYLLARLRSGDRPENILQEVRPLLTQQPVTASHVLAAGVQVEAAQLIGDHEPRVEAMEYILAHQGMMPSELTGLVNITGDSVWDAYVAYAQMLSNQQQLLMGNFEPWFAVAQSLAKEHPIRARALFAFLAMRADTVEIRVSAHQQLITLLSQLPQGAALMRALYVKLERFR